MGMSLFSKHAYILSRTNTGIEENTTIYQTYKDTLMELQERLNQHAVQLLQMKILGKPYKDTWEYEEAELLRKQINHTKRSSTVCRTLLYTLILQKSILETRMMTKKHEVHRKLVDVNNKYIERHFGANDNLLNTMHDAWDMIEEARDSQKDEVAGLVQMPRDESDDSCPDIETLMNNLHDVSSKRLSLITPPSQEEVSVNVTQTTRGKHDSPLQPLPTRNPECYDDDDDDVECELDMLVSSPLVSPSLTAT